MFYDKPDWKDYDLFKGEFLTNLKSLTTEEAEQIDILCRKTLIDCFNENMTDKPDELYRKLVVNREGSGDAAQVATMLLNWIVLPRGATARLKRTPLEQGVRTAALLDFTTGMIMGDVERMTPFKMDDKLYAFADDSELGKRIRADGLIDGKNHRLVVIYNEQSTGPHDAYRAFIASDQALAKLVQAEADYYKLDF